MATPYQPTKLKNIIVIPATGGGLTFGPVAVQLNVDGRPVVPDTLAMEDCNWSAAITTLADNTSTIIFTNNEPIGSPARATRCYVEYWNSPDRALSADSAGVIPGGVFNQNLPTFKYGAVCTTAQPPANDGAMFFGLAGGAVDDYPAPIAPGAAVQFPQDGPAFVGTGIVRLSPQAWRLTEAGIYEVAWSIQFDQASELVLFVGPTFALSVVVPSTVSMSGFNVDNAAQNNNTVFIRTAAANQLSLRNPLAGGLVVSHPTAALTSVQAPSLVIKRVA